MFGKRAGRAQRCGACGSSFQQTGEVKSAADGQSNDSRLLQKLSAVGLCHDQITSMRAASFL